MLHFHLPSFATVDQRTSYITCIYTLPDWSSKQNKLISIFVEPANFNSVTLGSTRYPRSELLRIGELFPGRLPFVSSSQQRQKHWDICRHLLPSCVKHCYLVKFLTVVILTNRTAAHWLLAWYCHLSICLSAGEEMYCGQMIHPTAKMSEHANRKWQLGTRFYNFQPLHWPYSLKLPTYWTINASAVWQITGFLWFLSINFPNVGHFYMKILSLCSLWNFLTTTNLQCFTYWTARSGACYKNWCARPKSRTSTSYENTLWMNGISWISASATKRLESSKRDWACVVAGGGQFEHKTLTFLIADVLSCAIFEG